MAVVWALCTLAACTPHGHSDPRILPGGFVLLQKGEYQILYGPDGKRQRLLRDANGDGVAEVVVLCGPDGKPERAEIDSDGDGVVDRWETSPSDRGLETTPQ